MHDARTASWKYPREDASWPACDPIAAARAILARFPIHGPEDLAIELMAAACGAYVVPRLTGTADARVVRDGGRAFIGIDPEALDTARGRFSCAHELAHNEMHCGSYDAIARIHGALRVTAVEERCEREANECASELVLPTFLLRPICASQAPILENVSRAAATFRTSLSATARKWVAVSAGPCAFVASRDGRITEVARGAAFHGARLKWDALIGAGTVAAELAGESGARTDARGMRVHRQRWGSASLGLEIVEESLRVSGSNLVLTWLWHD